MAGNGPPATAGNAAPQPQCLMLMLILMSCLCDAAHATPPSYEKQANPQELGSVFVLYFMGEAGARAKNGPKGVLKNPCRWLGVKRTPGNASKMDCESSG